MSQLTNSSEAIKAINIVATIKAILPPSSAPFPIASKILLSSVTSFTSTLSSSFGTRTGATTDATINALNILSGSAIIHIPGEAFANKHQQWRQIQIPLPTHLQCINDYYSNDEIVIV